MAATDASRHFACVLTPAFSFLPFASAVEGLRAANMVLGRPAYSWTVHAPNRKDDVIAASCGLSMACRPIDEVRSADIVAVFGGNESYRYDNRELRSFLRRCARSKQVVGAVSDASFILAAARLFDGRRSTIHWRFQHLYRERFLHLDIRSSLFEIDGSVFSCVGGTTTLDLVSRMIMADHGAGVAAEVAENFLHEQIRPADQQQRMSSVFRNSAQSPDLARALFLIEANLEAPLSIRELCQRLRIPQRQLHRMFQRYLQTSPQDYYRKQRLQRAGQLLKQSSLSVSAIAVSCGFSSPSHLSRYFRLEHGQSPMSYRLAHVGLHRRKRA